jgi:hypothetical protein
MVITMIIVIQDSDWGLELRGWPDKSFVRIFGKNRCAVIRQKCGSFTLTIMIGQLVDGAHFCL